MLEQRRLAAPASLAPQASRTSSSRADVLSRNRSVHPAREQLLACRVPVQQRKWSRMRCTAAYALLVVVAAESVASAGAGAAAVAAAVETVAVVTAAAA